MKTLRVLITDDELGMRLGVSRTLRGFTIRVPGIDGEVGFSVEEAATGEAGLERIRQLPPDVLLLDHKMPGISGLDVLDQLGPMGLDMWTIMITAFASADTAKIATQRGADAFLAKPFTPAELRDAIEKAATHLLLTRRSQPPNELRE
ncbi:MAG: response regulator [Patescibacteria group bacterium]|nr:response regulator [Patescibacteria group bacterium]